MAWRMTMMSGFMASMLRAVSDSVSPFCTALVDAEMFNVSAERRFAAISKEVRVRVDGSKNRFTTVLPRRVGTFLISLLLNLLHVVGGVQEKLYLFRGQVLQPQNVLVFESHG